MFELVNIKYSLIFWKASFLYVIVDYGRCRENVRESFYRFPCRKCLVSDYHSWLCLSFQVSRLLAIWEIWEFIFENFREILLNLLLWPFHARRCRCCCMHTISVRIEDILAGLFFRQTTTFLSDNKKNQIYEKKDIKNLTCYDNML